MSKEESDERMEDRDSRERREDAMDYEDSKLIPDNSIEFEYTIIDPEWGEDSAINPELKKLLVKMTPNIVNKGERFIDEEGNVQTADDTMIIIKYTDLWQQTGILTKDARLSNFTKVDIEDFRYFYDLGYDCLNMNCNEAAVMCLARGGVIGESSQGRTGFLRNNMRERRIIRKTTESKEKNGMSFFSGRNKE